MPSDGSVNIEETFDEHAVDQIDRVVFKPVRLAGDTRAISDGDLKEALSRRATTDEANNHSEAALSPQEDLI